jgi:hypothetical protein
VRNHQFLASLQTASCFPEAAKLTSRGCVRVAVPVLPKEGDYFFVSFVNLALPMVVDYLLIFYIIFEVVCGGFAELTYFADREFYQGALHVFPPWAQGV